jgi:prepilin-type N-terminal cleavage/methylation domain-containing protein
VQIRRQVHPPRGAKARPGFTAIELVVAVVVAGVLAGIAIPQISKQTSRRAAHNARDAFIATTAQARSAAIRAGEEVLMEVDRVNDRVRITRRSDGAVMAAPLDLADGTLRGAIVATETFTLCYSPRGFTLPSCTTHTPADSIVGFASPQGRDTAWARITIGRAQRR